MMKKRALDSVSDKTGIIDLATALVGMGVEILSTGGTATSLANAGLPVTLVSDVTGFPEMLEGRVKTLHPAIHGGLLADRSKPEHMAAIAEHGIKPIDLVVINLYPFAETIAKPGVSHEDAIENIDIGGPSMIRSAAKNHAAVAVVVSPADYPALIAEIESVGGYVSQETRSRLAAKSFSHTAAYDSVIAGYLSDKGTFPDTIPLAFTKLQDLRYGDHTRKQRFYKQDGVNFADIAAATAQREGTLVQ